MKHTKIHAGLKFETIAGRVKFINGGRVEYDTFNRLIWKWNEIKGKYLFYSYYTDKTDLVTKLNSILI